MILKSEIFDVFGRFFLVSRSSVFFSLGIRIPVFFLLVEMLAPHSSTGPPGVNQVDGLPPALSLGVKSLFLAN